MKIKTKETSNEPFLLMTYNERKLVCEANVPLRDECNGQN